MSLFVVLSTDAGAPALSGTNGSFITVADFVLTTIAGYTKTFSGTNKGIYKPPYGLGYSVRFVHDSSISGVASAVTVRGVESATGIDTYLNPYPNPLQASDTTAIWPTSTAATGTARAYVFVVSDGAPGGPPPFIHYAADIAGAGYYMNYAWGEAVPIEGVDNYCSYCTSRITAASNGANVVYSMNSITAISTTPKLFWARSRDGSIISSYGYLYNPYTIFGPSMGAYTTGPAFPSPDTGDMHIQKIMMGDLYSQTGSSVGYAGTSARAYLPNVWNALHGTYTGISAYDTFEVANASSGQVGSGAQFMFIPYGNSGNFGGLILEVTPTWIKP